MPESDADLGNVPARDVRAALQRVVASAPFRAAPQLIAFLTFLVETTLAGKAHEIKGYTIAVAALGRSADFDPVSDPIVRVEAGRLRRALEAYYAGEGQADPVRLIVERGGYVPRFAWAGSVPEARPAAVSRPASAPGAQVPGGTRSWSRASRLIGLAAACVVLAGLVAAALHVWRPAPSGAPSPGTTETVRTAAPRIQPLVRIERIRSGHERTDTAADLFARTLAQALSRFDEFVVVESEGEGEAGATAADDPGAAPFYRIELRPEVGSGQLLAVIVLVDAADGRLVWSSSTERDLSKPFATTDVVETARRVAVRLAQPYGVIHADLRGRTRLSPLLQCIVKAHDYWLSTSPASHLAARTCLENAVRDRPEFFPSWPLLAVIRLDEYRLGYNNRGGDVLADAYRIAHRGRELAPESARAAQSLMAVLMVRGQMQDALQLGYEAVRRNPFDTDILADLGARLVQAGRPADGRKLLVRAADLNPARPVWHDYYLYLSAFLDGDAAAAAAAAADLARSTSPLALLARTLNAISTGQMEQARGLRASLAAASPVFAADPAAFLDRFGLSEAVKSRLLIELARVNN